MDNDKAFALVQREKKVFDTACERKGQPRPTDLHSRSFLLRAFQAPQAACDSHQVVIIGQPYPPCTTPLAELESISIANLRLETVHYGKRLVLRTFGHPSCEDGVLNAVEDAAGNVDRLVVYYCAQDVLPRGRLVAIKEPYYKATTDGGCAIRVDHPSNLVVLEEDDDLVPEALRDMSLVSLVIDVAKSHKQKGNAAFEKQDYAQAVRCYSQGLKVIDADDPIKYDLYRNRAVANIKLGHHEMALEDAKAAVIPGPMLTSELKNMNGKAFYRAGCAAYNLQRYSAASSFFERVLELTPNDKDAQRELKRAGSRLDQSSSGSYNFEAMTRQLERSIKRRLDCASFTANVEIQSTTNKGRGLFAVCDMEVGELVLCEKAFCTAGFAGDAHTATSLVVNLVNSTMSVDTHAACLVKVIQKLVHSPQRAARFLDLYDGNYRPRPTSRLVDGVVPVDTYQVHCALDINSFSCSSVASTVPEIDENDGPTGVWLVSSAINHSCIGNVSRSFVGDLLLLRANRHIKAGDEILMRYKNPKNGVDELHATLQKTWAFTCTCELCVAELAVSGHQRKIRASAVTRVAALMEAYPVLESDPPSLTIIAQVEALRDQIRDTYSDSLFKDLPRPALHMVHIWLCMAYTTQGMCDATLDAAQRVFRDLGIRVTEQQEGVHFDTSNSRLDMAGIHAAMYVAQMEQMKGRSTAAQQYEDFGEKLYLVLCGSMHGFSDFFASSF